MRFLKTLSYLLVALLGLGFVTQLFAGGRPNVQAFNERLSGRMIAIPSGSFSMGSNETSDESPVHNVAIKGFNMSETEVTFNQWDTCVAQGGCSHKPGDSGWGRGNRPVMDVSYKDITEQYIPWLNKATGQCYRLPSEAEWEYAARAGSTTKYSWGESIGRNRANCDGCGSQWDNSKTAPVKSFKANAFGLYDMHGNVWEWTGDCLNDSYNDAPSDGSGWSRGDCTQRMLHGGSWGDNPGGLRSAYRGRNTVSGRLYTYGFRLAQGR